MTGDVARTLTGLAEFGAFFTVEVAEPGPGWRSLADVLADDADVADRVARTADRLGTDQSRPAASIWHLGIAARLWSPLVGALLTDGVVPDLSPGRVFWAPAAATTPPMRVPSPTARADGDVAAAAAAFLDPLAAATRRAVKIAPGLLRGNAASALAGALQMLVTARPALRPAALALGARLLDGPLAGTGTLAAPGRPFFVRRSCCLYYRLPTGAPCGDCPFAG
ncbi:(2Fe-2S)-binding protein [Actinomadura atramentaria]|uniref:(2Fe-2S)-binding protein n=1 Tax=Actinomadura atramentaria TaxID=1990 RepID=UPI00037BC3F6|nr:(2Fe-2S)-binding protein [Actinomadura atramentaria]